MTVIYHPNTSAATGKHNPLVGTGRRGPGWALAVRAIRVGIDGAWDRAGWRKDLNANAVADLIIENINVLDRRAVHVLAVVLTLLVRKSQRARN
jgi:hypothetical protein